MTPTRSQRVAGLAPGSVILAVAILCLAAALVYPTLRGRAFRAVVEAAIADVDAVTYAARSALQSDRSWPATTPPGQAPPELAALGGPEGPFAREEYTLAWTAWEVVDSVSVEVDRTPAPGDDNPPEDTGPEMAPVARQTGGITVRTDDERLLAELFAHYGPDVSFVLDSTWTLILPERAPLPGEAGSSFLGR